MPAPEPILFPDAEALATTLLTSALAERPEPAAADVYVDRKDPATRRARMVLVRRDGGNRLDLVRDAARLTVRVYGSTDDEARDLAALVRAILGAAADGSTPLLSVREVAGPLVVETKGLPDYLLLTYELTVKGAPLV